MCQATGNCNTFEDLDIGVSDDSIEAKGRNSRKPKKSNHGARPCSSFMRKLKIKGWYRKLKNVS